MTKNVTLSLESGSNARQDGFSLIELLIVVTVIGVIATLAVPALHKATLAAENGNTFATMRTMSSTQMTFMSQNGRFARLAELNSASSNALGTVSGLQLVRGKFIFEMPGTPTDTDLRGRYTITATRNVAAEGVVYKYEIDQSGEIRQILP